MNDNMNELKERMFLQQYIKNAQKQNQRLYVFYLIKKLNQEELSFDFLTEQELLTFTREESLTDKQIASLFSVKREDVRQRRLKWNISKELYQSNLAV